MIIVVTGANGLLGRHAVEHLVAEQHQVHAFVHSAPSMGIPGAKYHIVDLSTDWDARGLPDQLDVIIHLAQSSHFRDLPDQAMDVFGVNVSSTARLLDYARQCGAKQFILASSGGVYGAGSEAFKEDAVLPHPGTLGYYLASKLCAEILAKNYASLMDVTVLRFFFMYGHGQKRSMLIPRLVDNVIAGRPITLQGRDGIRINPIHVSDAVAALSASFGKSGSNTFNVAGAEIMSMRKITERIGQAVQCTPIFIVNNEAPFDLIADIEALRDCLIAPRVSFSSGIVDLVP